jgi:leader peptidase (prepilin peptidase)/N-methyltransferase
MVGSFLGLSGAIQTLLLGSVSGTIISLIYIKLTGKDAANYELPFGSFLGAAALVVVILGKAWMRS